MSARLVGRGALSLALAACSASPDAPLRTQPVVAGRADVIAGSSSGAGGRGGTSEVDAAVPMLLPNAEAILMGRCATSSKHSQLLPSNLLFVVDRSASMLCNPPPLTDSATCEASPLRTSAEEPSKWEIMRDALHAALLALPEETVVGLTYFSNDDACGVHALPSVPLSPLDERQRAALRASLDNVRPDGATPLVGAAVLAYRHLHEQALAGEIHGGKYVVLITDGEQSEACSDQPRCDTAAECTLYLTGSEAPKAAGEGVGIKTFVIGVPGSEPAREVLSQLAFVGGTARAACDVAAGECHFDMTSQEAFGPPLERALNEIAGRRLDCELPLPTTEDGELDRERLNVVHSPAGGGPPTLVPQDTRAGCESGADGWQYNDDGSLIRLCGPTCERVRADRGGRLDVVLGCPVRGPT